VIYNFQRYDVCLAKTYTFQNALKKQMEGLTLSRFINGTIDLVTTLKKIPQHFNVIFIFFDMILK